MCPPPVQYIHNTIHYAAPNRFWAAVKQVYRGFHKKGWNVLQGHQENMLFLYFGPGYGGTIIYKSWIWISPTYQQVPITYRNTTYLIGTHFFFKITPALLRKCPGQIPLKWKFLVFKNDDFQFYFFCLRIFQLMTPFYMYLKKLEIFI